MDALSGDRGQALVLAALLAGIAAAAVLGLRTVSEGILHQARDVRAGEAAVSAAATAVSDILLGREREIGRALEPDELVRLAAESATTEAARAAAVRLAREHRRADPTGVRVLAFGYELEVRVTLAGREHVALLGYEP